MKIAVIGRSAYAKILKKYLRKGFVIKYFSSLNDENLKKFKNIDWSDVGFQSTNSAFNIRSSQINDKFK